MSYWNFQKKKKNDYEMKKYRRITSPFDKYSVVLW